MNKITDKEKIELLNKFFELAILLDMEIENQEIQTIIYTNVLYDAEESVYYELED